MSKSNFIITPKTYKRLYSVVKKHGSEVSPRGVMTTELVNANLVLRNPVDRVVTDRNRKINIAFAIAEFYALIFAIENLDFFTRFISSYDQFTTDGETLDGAYGTRVNFWLAPHLRGSFINPVLETVEVRNQIEMVVRRLEDDRSDRRAVISIHNASDLFGGGGKNTPCTLSLQFLIRDGQLDMITTMRSNDIFKGLPYDMFSFTMLQEFVASSLAIPVGKYYHNAGSLHYYHDDIPALEKMSSKRHWPFTMGKMPSNVPNRLPLNFFKAGMQVAYQEHGNLVEFINSFVSTSSMDAYDFRAIRYYANLLCTVSAFINRKVNKTIAIDSYGSIEDPTLRYAVYPWLDRHITNGKYRMRGVDGK